MARALVERPPFWKLSGYGGGSLRTLGEGLERYSRSRVPSHYAEVPLMPIARSAT